MASPPKPGSLASRLQSSSTVLVVEDEPDIATFLGAFFRASGNEVVHVNPATTAEVVELMVELSAACALVDLRLEGLSGFEILEAINDDPRVNSTPVVIVTGDTRPSIRERAVELGAAAFIPKPFNVKDLFATVQALVEGDPLLGDGDGAEATVRRSALRGGLLPADILQERLGAAVGDAKRDGGSAAFALVRILGAAAGQPSVATELARVLDEALKGADVLGASAPDELAVLFPIDTAESAHQQLTQALRDAPFSVELPAGRAVTVDCAVGLAASPEHATTADELYMAADAALTEAVESGQLLSTAR